MAQFALNEMTKSTSLLNKLVDFVSPFASNFVEESGGEVSPLAFAILKHDFSVVLIIEKRKRIIISFLAVSLF